MALLCMGVRLLEDRAHKRTFIADETLRLLVVSHSRLAFWISRCFVAVGFISRKRRERKQGKSDIICAFVRHEIPMMLATKLFNQRYPHLSVRLELFDLEGIDHIAKIASNQSVPFWSNVYWATWLSRSRKQGRLCPRRNPPFGDRPASASPSHR